MFWEMHSWLADFIPGLPVDAYPAGVFVVFLVRGFPYSLRPIVGLPSRR
jgi:hypothetical protein